MHRGMFGDAAKAAARRRRRIWQTLVSVLSCIVVFCVTYALILPALTLEKTPLAEGAAPATTPLKLDDYIHGASLSYRTDPKAEWQPVTASTVLPGNAELKLDISYDGVHVDALREAGYQVTYTLPSILRSPTGSGQINDSSNQKMGTMTVENSVVTLTFDETWLDTHHGSEGTKEINGTFHVQSGIDLTQAGNDPATQITVGNVTIGLQFENDIIANYADVAIQKSSPVAIHNKNGDYLEYTLTVTAGQDGAPSVVVKDALQDPGQILGYVGISEATPAGADDGPAETVTPTGAAGALAMQGSTMEWAIGDMAPNEVRTLTYRVKLKDGYLGGKAPTDPVVNTAKLSCGEYERDEVTSSFTPKAEATLTKVAGEYIPGSNGGGTITYTIWIHAFDTNNYTLTNVKIWDALDGSIGNNNATNAAYLPHLSFEEGSFRLYNGGSEKQNGADGLTGETQIQPVFQEKNGETNLYYLFCDVGTLAPGESKTLTYTVQVAPGMFPAAGNNAPRIQNRAQVHAGDSAKGNETTLNSYNATKDIAKKEWSHKYQGVEQTAETTISTTGKVLANGTLTENAPIAFTAPAGSYLYQVDVNAARDWDVSKTSLEDRLSEFSKYIGYVKAEAFETDASGNPALVDTVWLPVDGKTSFTLEPETLNWTGQRSYHLTYYTQVTLPAGASVVNVDNTFAMTGQVGIGGKYYPLNASVTVSNTIQGSSSFAVSKHSWYYEPAKVSTGEYANGAMYWYIQVDGDAVPANTYLKDVTSWNPQFIYSDSLVGLYTGDLGEGSISGYDDLEDLLASGKLTRLPESGYSVSTIKKVLNGKNYQDMVVHITDDIRLGEKSLFLIIKMEPHLSPADLSGKECRNYHNAVQSSYNGSNWVDWGDAKVMTLYGSNGISKTLEKVSAWDGTTETVVTPENGTTTPVALTGLESGTYVSWNIQLNLTGRLNGSYCVEEQIPDGLELAYVECTGVGAGYRGTKPSCAQKTLDGWTEHQRAGQMTTYYYTNGQTAHWYVDGLQASSNDRCTVDFRVVCRVTDADVLLGGQEKTFENQVRLLREGGKELDASSAPVTLQVQSLSKNGLYSNTEPTRFPFEVTLNPLGEDLVPGNDTVSLVDTLGETLKLDLSSIQVKDTVTGEPVTGWESAVNGQTLTLTLPDQKALTVTYSAWINAKPGDFIQISNNAHWEGYPTPSGGAVEEDNFEFNISGSAGTTDAPVISITKLDENHLSMALQGAEFALTKAELVNDVITETADPAWTGTTDANGKLSFGEREDQNMNYNTIYCLRETKAPEGYVLDSTPHYFVIAQEVDGAYPTFPEGVHVHYLGSQYSYQALNHKGQITVQKKFTDPGGNDCAPVAGTYTFGLYQTADAQGDPLQTVTITYTDTDTQADKTAVFRDLALGNSYYVFELDAEGKPVFNGGVLSKHFTVHYRYSGDVTSAALTAEAGEQTVTVTNQVHSPKLPEAGGIGTTIFYTAGCLLLTGAALPLLTKKRRNPKA